MVRNKPSFWDLGIGCEFGSQVDFLGNLMHKSSMAVSLVFLVMVFLASFAHGLCRDKCGDTAIKFPFGVDPGCGDPEHMLNCEGDNLTVSFEQWRFPISSIDYDRDYLVLNTTGTFLLNPGSICSPVPLDGGAYNNISVNDYILCKFGEGLPIGAFEEQFKIGRCEFDRGALLEKQFPHLTCYNYSKKPLAPLQGTDGNENFLETWPFVSYVVIPWIVAQEVKQKCDSCEEASKGVCGYNTTSTDPQFLCICRDGHNSTTCGGNVTSQQNAENGKSNQAAVIGGSAAGAAALLLLSCLGGCYYFVKRRKKQATVSRGLILDGSKPPYDSTDAQFLQSPSHSSHEKSTRFCLKELQDATDNFSEDGRLGDGGFGTVYRGKLRDGRLVAVKKLNPWNAQGKHQFDNEVNILSEVMHPHLVRLYGCCVEGRELLLVYEYVPNGTLADHIHDHRNGFLNWETRLTIVTQTAEALAFLHNDVMPPIYHRDVKSTNILIDQRYYAKVGDFGLSRLVPSLELTHVTTAPQGTPGYLDPDYHESYQLTDKSDVYSLGVVLMEIVSSQRAVDMSRDRKEINLAALAVSRIKCGQLDKLFDPKLGTDDDPVRCDMVKSVTELAFECLATDKDDRPSMRTVATRLKQIQEEAKKRYLEKMLRGSMTSAMILNASKFTKPGESPTSVQMQWDSSTTSPNNSSGSM